MATVSRAERRGGPVSPVAAAPSDGSVDSAGVYLTDDAFLYRVVGTVARERGELVELEDCYWLDVVQVPIRDLRARRLRVVTPESG